MSTNTFVRSLGDALGASVQSLSRLGGKLGRRLRKPALIIGGGIVLLMLLIVVLQSGLGVDSDDTITDSQRPEIVGD